MENRNRDNTTKSAKKKKKRINRTFRTVGKFLVLIQMLLTLIFIALPGDWV